MINQRTGAYGILLLRVSLGLLFLAHVSLKIFVFTIPGTVGYFQSLGFSALFTYVVIALELLGGIALIVGFYAPYVALPLAIEILGTIITVHGANGWQFANEGGGWEFPALWAVALVALALLGDGAFALRSTRTRSKRLGASAR